MARLIKQDEGEREQMGQQERGGRHLEPAAEGQDDERDVEVEGVGVVAQEVAYAVVEGMEVAMEGEDGEIQPNAGADQLARLREELEERLENNVGALMEEERDHRMVLDAEDGQGGAHNQIEQLADTRDLGNGRPDQMEQCQLPRSPSPPPVLERVTLPLEHFAQINTVLLLGGEGALCATGSRDRNVKLWDLQSGGGKLLHTLVGQGAFSTHQGWVWCMACRGSVLASGSFDSTVKLWDVQAGGAERGLIRTGASVQCLSYQPDVLLAGTHDRKVNMYDTRGEGSEYHLNFVQKVIKKSFLCFLPLVSNDSHITHSFGQIICFSVFFVFVFPNFLFTAAEPLVKSLRLHSKAVMCLAADEKYIVSGSTDCTVAVYERRAGKALKRLRVDANTFS